jgi:hypothetical protein
VVYTWKTNKTSAKKGSWSELESDTVRKQHYTSMRADKWLLRAEKITVPESEFANVSFNTICCSISRDETK